MGFNFEKLSVLLVEDTLPMQQIVSSVLETLGVGRVMTANDGNEGFKALCKENPDILLTDWHMPTVNGLELVDMVRNNPESPNKLMPVIMITGYSAVARVTTARDLGTTEFLVKPFTANDLARRIAHVINKPRDFIKTTSYFGPDRRRRIIEGYQGPYRRSTDPENWEVTTANDKI